MNDTVSTPDPEGRLAAWRFLAGDSAAGLVEDVAIAIKGGLEPRDIASLRRHHPDAPIAEAIELVRARNKVAGRMADVDRLLMDRQGAEQASSTVVAAWKASRFGDRPVIDLCSGIGGDAMALAARGACRGVDRDPIRAFMTGFNAGIEGCVGEAEAVPVEGGLVHLDPARRDESTGRRHWRIEDLSPGPDAIRAIVDRAEGGAIKLGPGLPRPFPEFHERQSVSIVSEHRRLVQAVVWTGSLAGVDSVEAVDLPSGEVLAGEPEEMPVGESPSLETGPRNDGLLLVEFHPAVERASLGPVAWRNRFGDAFMSEPAAGLGLGLATLGDIPTSRRSVASSRWIRLTGVRAIERPKLDRVEGAIRRLVDVGGRPARIVVRTRAAAIDADDWTQRLGRISDPSLGADGPTIEVHGLRFGRRTLVLIGDPFPVQESSE